MLNFWADLRRLYHRSEFDPAQRIILHCTSGCRSALAADRFLQMGYSNVAHLDGGFTAWKEAGRPVEDLAA
jgi:rhodanese-related sulfurtransferase